MNEIHIPVGADERTLDMALRYAHGETLDAIGRSYSITRERVRQIIAASGLTCADDARAARREQRETAIEQIRCRVRAWVAGNPGRSRKAAADALGIAEEVIRDAMGAEGRLCFVETRKAEPLIDDEAVLSALQAAAAVHGNPLAADNYDLYSHEQGTVSSIRIIQRWGTWNNACRAAGLEINRGRPTYRRRWTDAQMVEHVADYLMTPDARGSYTDYDDYARRTADAPSAQTVRNAFHGWTSVKAAAQHVVAARERRQRVA